MTEQLIKDIKHIQHCLINREMSGDGIKEKMEIVKKLEDVSDYLKDALGRGNRIFNIADNKRRKTVRSSALSFSDSFRFLSYSAGTNTFPFRTVGIPTFRNIFKSSSWSDSVVRITYCRVIFVSAWFTYIFLHKSIPPYISFVIVLYYLNL